MRNYVLRRVLSVIPTLLGVSIIVFVMIRLIPGDPIQILLGEDYGRQAAQELRAKWGLDRPLVAQYGVFLERLVLHGDLGNSIRSGNSVASELARPFARTLALACAAMAMALVVSVPVGVLSGVRPYGGVDTFARVVALLGVSVPVFWLGLMLVLVFSVKLRVFPAIGSGSIRHLVLPAVTLSGFLMANVVRQTRASVMEVVNMDYVRTARAKGLPNSRVVGKHVLKNSLIPVVTVIGVLFGRTLGGSILTETVFAYPGLGRLMVTAILARDYPVVQGAILLFSVVFVFLNLAVDLVYSLIDPRITYA